MSEFVLSLRHSNRAYRIAVGLLFFMQGLCFASWASRIPSIQEHLHLSDAALGIVLFALPVGSMAALPLAGWMVSKFGSKRMAANAIVLYSIMLVALGLASNITVLVLSLVVFGMAGNVANIAINTQAVGVEARYGRKIMASFHGLWSLAGFTAGGIGTLMIGKGIIPFHHFLVIMSIILFGIAASFQYLLPHEKGSTGTGRLLAMPDKTLFRLGIIAFCCMICEGAMFDWSGIYFQKVVRAEKEWIGLGYTAFMCTMAAGRFIADWVTHHIGFKKTIQASGLLITTGLAISILFPFMVPSVIGFFLVGFGVSSVVPLVYSEAGKSKRLLPGVALAAVSSIGFLGFLIGPPLIGVVAGMAGLRVSFMIIAIMGFCVSLMVNGKER
ncbi:MFS transporter [Chitinophagaceae bacterium LB-8]|uniref:MFS transporter n=1 Tax=Paraflavisolibacter caeni TaxID=2982496 RepID=A0A9X3BFI3_9BACT|nr:MFS transporter [Paraflavisolibacter caeni]MCU7548919.1 MFS transporter [Paraflavisolibacter caeni]